MILWLDAQLPPAIAPWITENFKIKTFALRSLGLRDAEDREIFERARETGAVIMTKDRDFLQLQEVLGVPPAIVWLTCGNTSNARLREIFAAALPQAIQFIRDGEWLVEIQDRP